MAIDKAARAAIRSNIHPPSDIYMDRSFYHSLDFDYRFDKNARPQYRYEDPGGTAVGYYFAENVDTISGALRAEQSLIGSKRRRKSAPEEKCRLHDAVRALRGSYWLSSLCAELVSTHGWESCLPIRHYTGVTNTGIKRGHPMSNPLISWSAFDAIKAPAGVSVLAAIIGKPSSRERGSAVQ